MHRKIDEHIIYDYYIELSHTKRNYHILYISPQRDELDAIVFKHWAIVTACLLQQARHILFRDKFG
jgi:hypothetical protein